MKQGASGSRNHKNHTCTTPTSRKDASLVKVESIFINIVAAELIKPEKCEHFTIRGFVSESREQNGTLQWPPSVNGVDAGSKEINLTNYPLHTPRFKSWRCQSCLNEIDVAAAAAKKDSHSNAVKCRRQLKAKSSRSHGSLENAYLSKKLKRSERGRGRTLCDGIRSASKFKQKLKQRQKQKQIQNLDSALHLNTRGLGENELRHAANGSISNQHDSMVYVDRHQKDLLRPTASASTKFVSVDISQHNERHEEATKLVQQQHDDLIGTGCRKTKAKKVRLLNEILEKDGKTAKPAVTRGFITDESAKASCSGMQSMKKNQFDNNRCQADQERYSNYHEQDRKWSPLHFANSVDGNGKKRKSHGLDGPFTNTMHGTSNEGQSDAIIEQGDKLVKKKAQRAVGHQNYPSRGHKSNNDAYWRREQLSICQPSDGRVADTLQKISLPNSQMKGKPNDYTIHKVHRGADMLSPSDNGEGLEGNNVTQKCLEIIQTGHQNPYVQPMQDRKFSRQHYSFTDGCLDARNSTCDWIPGSGNENLRNDTCMYMGESSSAHKSLVDINTRQGTDSFSTLKRPNQGSSVGIKKPKHFGRTEGGPTAVHQAEFLLRNSKKMCGKFDNPENTLREMRGNMVQEAGTTDDIPMEIVELLAKNQYERHLHEVGDKRYVQQSGSYRKNDLVVSTNMLPNDVSQGPLPVKPQVLIAHSFSGNSLGFSNGKPNGHIVQQPSTGSTHRSLLSTQRDQSVLLQFPAVGSRNPDIYPIQNCKYDMNKLASEQRVSSESQAQFELWQPTSKQRDKTGRDWPMVQPNNPVHKSSVLQGNVLQSFDVGEASKCPSYVGEGRDFGNLAATGKKTNKFRSKTSHISRPNRVDSSPQDPYANETIPAMHLLSLGRPQSSTPTKMVDVANRKTFERSFTNDHLAKELSGNSFAAVESIHKLKQPSPYGYHKNPQSDASCQCSPPVPTFSSATATLHGDVRDKHGVQLHHQERTFLNLNSGGSHLLSENKSIKYQKSPLSGTVGVAFQQLIPARQLAKHILSPSWSVSSSSDLQINGNFFGYPNWVAPKPNDTLNKRAEPGVCWLNQNPMEFTTPGPGNEFMIGPEDLQLRKTYPPNVTGPMVANLFKQLGFVKYAAPNSRR